MNPPIDELRLPEGIRAGLRREARKCYPEEACGLLIGECRDTRATVQRLFPAENRAQRADRFLIDAPDVFDAMMSARDSGQELLGVYHSHPRSGPAPSETDRSDAWHEWLYLIVSVDTPSHEDEHRNADSNMACWRWNGETFDPVGLCVVADTQEAKR